MQKMVTIFIEKWGYFGIFFLIALENIFPPIPSEVILTFTGFFTTCSNLDFIMAFIFSVLGALFGAIILYILGNLISSKKIENIFSGKLGKILRLKPENIEKANKWFYKKGSSTVFFCRFIPIVRSLISIPAGMSRMRLSKFITYTFFGTLIWNFILMYVGKIMGDNWEVASGIISRYSNYLLYLLVLGLLGFIIFKKTKKNKKMQD